MSAAPTERAGDREFMARALQLARRGLYSTDPNPRVGCVIVRDDEVIGEGYHERAGQAHAEVLALRQAAEAARGATAYVTLEPCSHTGRTPPCTNALISAGIARVVYAIDDPDPRVNGGGVRALRAAGIDALGGVLADEARALNPGFFKRMQQGLPWVRIKIAASLDGRTALANGESQWITGEAARADVQYWRARSSVVLSGSGTVLADDPLLTARLPELKRQPMRVIIDSRLRVPATARVFDSAGAVVFTTVAAADRYAALRARHVGVEHIAAAPDGHVPLEAMLRRLAVLEANEIWVEAGATLAGALLQARLVDELIVYLAPSLLGDQARPLVQLPQLQALSQRLVLRFCEFKPIGEDLRILARPMLASERDR